MYQFNNPKFEFAVMTRSRNRIGGKLLCIVDIDSIPIGQLFEKFISVTTFAIDNIYPVKTKPVTNNSFGQINWFLDDMKKLRLRIFCTMFIR